MPGDARGWVKTEAPGIQAPNALVEEGARAKLGKTPVMLTEEERQIVEQTIRRHCKIRNWTLHALNVRTNHIHVVVSAAIRPEKVMGEFKAWCSRRLNERLGAKHEWWTFHGSTKWINDEAYLENTIRYVLEGQ